MAQNRRLRVQPASSFDMVDICKALINHGIPFQCSPHSRMVYVDSDNASFARQAIDAALAPSRYELV